MTGLLIYTTDNDDVAPPHFSFDGPNEQSAFIKETSPYVARANLFLCPQEQFDQTSIQESTGKDLISSKMDYSHCFSLKKVIPGFKNGHRLLNLNQISDLANTPYLRDSTHELSDEGPRSPHGIEFMVGFLDGHVVPQHLAKESKEY